MHHKKFIVIKSALALGYAMVLHSAIPLAVHAQEATNDTGVYGANIARADFPGGSYRMIGERKWGRYNENGELIRTFNETRRDDWAAEMYDPESGYHAIIDTLKHVVFETDPSTEVLTEFAAITAVAPIASNPRVALPTIPDDYPDWYREAWDKRFNGNAAHNQTWQAGATIATGPTQATVPQGQSSGQNFGQGGNSQQPQFATGPSQTTPSAPAGGVSSGGGGSGGGGFNPFDSNSQQPQSTPQASFPQQASNMNANGFPPSQGGNAFPASGNANANTSGNNGFAPPTPAPSDPALAHANISGVWVELNTLSRPSGDGERRAITWSTPKMVRFEALDGNNVSFLGNDEAVGWNVLSKRSDNSYSNGRDTATISQRGSSFYLNIVGGQYAGNYEIAKTADDDLSRARFDSAVQANKDSRRGLFNQDGLTREWNTNFVSFDGLEINLFEPSAGRRLQLFQQPGNFDYAVDDNLNLGLPYGLRGYRTRSSSSRQVETLITNSASFQKSWSVNFGGGFSSPKANFGVKYSQERTRGMSSRSSSMSAIGMARIERYTLLLDEPNATLSQNFIDAVERVGRGNMSADQFVSTWGTHYPKAITYGGLGKAEKTMTSTQVGEYLSKKYSVEVSGGAKGASLNGGFSESSSNSNGTESVFNRDEFQAVGGSGSMNFGGWQVSDNDTVPVRYDLRRLSDLINPILFPAETQQESTMHFQAKRKIRAAIDARMSSAPALNGAFQAPKFYEVELHEFRCTNKGDDTTSSITLRGSLEMKYFDDQGSKSVPIYAGIGQEELSCGGSGKSLIQKPLLIMGNGQSSSRNYGNVWFSSDLVEVDDGPVRDTGEQVRDGILTGITLGLNNRIAYNADDDMTGQTTLLTPVARSANGQRRTAVIGGGGNDPTLQVTYTIRELK
jgi:hypothetical protein